MDMRKETVVVETDRHRVHGAITLSVEGYRSRLSDHLNRDDLAFFTITDAVVTPLDGAEGWRAAVLMIGRRHVRLIAPDEDA